MLVFLLKYMHNSVFISSKYIEILIKSLRFFCIEMKLFYQAISIITTIDRDLPNVEKPTMHTALFCMLYAFFLVYRYAYMFNK